LDRDIRERSVGDRDSGDDGDGNIRATEFEETASDSNDQAGTGSHLRLVVHSTLWWTVGNSLTTGGFLTYFAAQMGIREQWMGLFLALPELAGGLACLTRSVDRGFANRKVTWVACSLLARIIAFAIPVSIFFSGAEGGTSRVVVMLFAVLGVVSVLQAMANVAWLSWMSEVFDRSEWGRLMAIRNIVVLLVLLTVPVGAGFLRDSLRSHPPWGLETSDALRYFSLFAFSLGNLVVLLSMIPMMGIPVLPPTNEEMARASWKVFREVMGMPGFRGVLWFQWWHAFWSGLTQAAFFDYRYHHLQVGLGTYYLLEAAMRLVQIPVCRWSGKLCDRGIPEVALGSGVIFLAISMLFWIVATPTDWWWIWGAYLLWGAWGAINVAGPVLSLRHAPKRDNTLHLGLSERGAGMCAGIAGLLGGWLLSAWLAREQAVGGSARTAFVGVFTVGMIGRFVSLYWLFRLKKQTSNRRAIVGEDEKFGGDMIDQPDAVRRKRE
jgi:hypothetical protein